MKVVILAGGRGTRLAPYTTILPKPLMPIGEQPILEILLWQMRRAGITEAIITVGHLANLIKTFFQDGEACGMPITYSYEDRPLGTAGPLSLVRDHLTETFVVANGDVLTTLNLRDMLSFHCRTGAIATIATNLRQVKLDLGVVEFNSSYLLSGYHEKPTYELFVSMGIYIFEPRILDFIAYNAYLDFPDLVRKLIKANEKVYCYHFDGYWQDLGRPDDYQRAIADFDMLRPQILGEEEAQGVL